MKDLHSKIKATSVIFPVAIGANGTKTGVIIDRKGYGGVEFICSYGNVTTTGSVATPVVLEGDVTGTMTSVADADLLGTEVLASLTATTPRTSGTTKNVSKRVGYKGDKRYVRVDMVGSGVTSAGCVSVTAVLHSPEIAPTSNP
ncbi:MAG TPA: hypothetical protein VN667_15420 [Burkholderiales bacterium]|nr:hypothetical protein [Burkholderiales bacterium]